VRLPSISHECAGPVFASSPLRLFNAEKHIATNPKSRYLNFPRAIRYFAGNAEKQKGRPEGQPFEEASVEMLRIWCASKDKPSRNVAPF
jgi:hypothetical protein